MKTGLKKIQKTTIIEFNEKNPRITVTTHNTDLKNRLRAYAEQHTPMCAARLTQTRKRAAWSLKLRKAASVSV